MKKWQNAKFAVAIALLFAVMFMLIGPSPVAAHTQLVSTHPAEGEHIRENVDEIELVFSDDVLSASTLQVTDSQGESIPLKNIQAEGNRISGFPETPLSAGVYTVSWKAASTDGHVVEGQFSFTVEVSGHIPGEAAGMPGEASSENGAPGQSGSDSPGSDGDGGSETGTVLSETEQQESQETASAAEAAEAAEPAEADEAKFNTWLFVLIGAALALAVLVLSVGRKRA